MSEINKNTITAYLSFFEHINQNELRCEVCGVRNSNIYHIEDKGDKDCIENLVALCRKDHEKYGDKKIFKDWLRNVHRMTMEQHLNKVSTK